MIPAREQSIGQSRQWSRMEHRVLGSLSGIKNWLWVIPKVENSYLDNNQLSSFPGPHWKLLRAGTVYTVSQGP